MKIGFNARLLYAPTLRGWNRYTVNLLSELSAMGIELFLYGDRPLHQSHLARLRNGTYHIRIAPPMRYFAWEQYWLPRQCAADRVELLHTPFNFGLPWFSPCPRVLTLHDAIDQVYCGLAPTRREKVSSSTLRIRLYHWIARASAERVITVSEHAKRDLVQILRLQPEKVAVIYEAADERFREPVSDDACQSVRQKYHLPRWYVLYVGGWERRKNVPFLLRAFAAAALPDVALVLAGGRQDQGADLAAIAEPLGLDSRLRLLGWVDDEDLPALYSQALCFVYPSQYEGFGLQLCEAMAAGCPTLAARATSLIEVLGTGGESFALQDHRELVGLLRRLAADDDFRTGLGKRGLERAREFSWEGTARQTLAIYTGLAEGKTASRTFTKVRE